MVGLRYSSVLVYLFNWITLLNERVAYISIKVLITRCVLQKFLLYFEFINVKIELRKPDKEFEEEIIISSAILEVQHFFKLIFYSGHLSAFNEIVAGESKSRRNKDTIKKITV